MRSESKNALLSLHRGKNRVNWQLEVTHVAKLNPQQMSKTGIATIQACCRNAPTK
jgi:hypothetical protein